MSPRDISDDTALSRRGSVALWFAVLGGPAAWFVSLAVSYFAVHEVCRQHTTLAPRIVSGVALVIAVAATIGGRGIWTRVAALEHNAGDRPVERTRFLAQLGVLGGMLFSLIILLQIIATLLLPSCRDRPRTPESPDVLAPPALHRPLSRA
jgi:hypothetical protein